MYARRILHHGSDPTATPTVISSRVVEGCWFELHRQGGCGAGELSLKDEFSDRSAVDIGDWISFEYEAGERWYLGRVEQRTATSPAGVRLRLEGMGIELNEVFPGGFALDIDDVPPHRFGRTDLFSNDPDYPVETFDSAADVSDLVTLLLQRYVAPATHIQYVPGLVEAAAEGAGIESVKFRGEESARSILKQLALAAGGAAWGVNASRQFFFLQPRTTVLTVLREGRDLTSLEESRDRELLFNRLLLTGDYVYDVIESGWIARRAYRFRGNYVQTDSRDLHGERRIRLWIPWIRTPEDALQFAREFFRMYAAPTTQYELETKGRRTLLLPWTGVVRLEDRTGAVIATSRLESIRVLFDHVPRFRLELGPADPRTLWPEPPEDERWELPEVQRAGGEVPLTGGTSSGGSGSLISLSSVESGNSATSAGSSAEPSSGGGSSGGDTSSDGGPTSGGGSGSVTTTDGSGGASSGGASSGGLSGTTSSSDTSPPSGGGGGSGLTTSGAPTSSGWTSSGVLSGQSSSSST